MLNRSDAIKNIFKAHGKDAIYITNTGYISRATYELHPESNNILYMQGSMGLGPAIGFGIALNTEKEVVVFVGDASLLMHLGITHTIKDYNLPNLFVYVLDNGCHESVGGHECAKLEESYPGITKIMKISIDGKRPRVSLPLVDNITNIKRLLNE